MLIAFEGGEGAGKDVQIMRLREKLSKLGYKVHCIIEPGGTDVGREIRSLIFRNKELGMLGITEAFLFSASRAQQVETVVKPALNNNYIVLSSRSFYCTFAYQGFARGIDLKTIAQLTDLAVGDTRPDFVILLDIDPKVGLSRKWQQEEITSWEEEKLSFHEKVRDGYLTLADNDPEKWFVIDASQSIEKIHDIVLKFVLSKLS